MFLTHLFLHHVHIEAPYGCWASYELLEVLRGNRVLTLELVEKANVKGRLTQNLNLCIVKMSSERCTVLREPVLGEGRTEMDSANDFQAGI